MNSRKFTFTSKLLTLVNMLIFTLMSCKSDRLFVGGDPIPPEDIDKVEEKITNSVKVTNDFITRAKNSFSGSVPLL